MTPSTPHFSDDDTDENDDIDDDDDDETTARQSDELLENQPAANSVASNRTDGTVLEFSTNQSVIDRHERNKTKEAKGSETGVRVRRSAVKHKLHKDAKPCRRKKMFVNFEDINWDRWIISPRGYQVYYNNCVTMSYIIMYSNVQNRFF